MDKRYPYIMMSDHRVRIDYSHNSGTGDDEAWTCRNCAVLNYKKRPTCFQCNISMQESVPIPAVPSAYHHSPTASPSAPTPGGADYGINDGGRDVGNAPHHILLVRGLDNLTTGEGVHTTFAALSSAVRRTLLVKDRMSRMSWGFAFVEYPDVQSASHVLSALTSQQARRQDRTGAPRRRPTPGVADFIVDDRPVVVSFAHPNSLAPVYVPSEWTVMGDGGSVLAYWDEQAYPCEFIAPPGGEAGGKGEEGKKEEKGPEKGTVGGGKVVGDNNQVPAPASSVDDELSAFYADVGATIFSGEEPESIFAVPKK
ncbi:hypothetical protein BC937DRAFT_89352 [Endogone sp. FLAS-F59071]|nr:hypothetical protein BC937DRAFT_89352 [Endogone sp. FLAS-F59071]|eukprot:RUS17918.1 hypothetical protein BC937DRAFT_89352 [Endogone sp. FLAS-F59071]